MNLACLGVVILGHLARFNIADYVRTVGNLNTGKCRKHFRRNTQLGLHQCFRLRLRIDEGNDLSMAENNENLLRAKLSKLFFAGLLRKLRRFLMLKLALDLFLHLSKGLQVSGAVLHNTG